MCCASYPKRPVKYRYFSRYLVFFGTIGALSHKFPSFNPPPPDVTTAPCAIPVRNPPAVATHAALADVVKNAEARIAVEVRRTCLIWVELTYIYIMLTAIPSLVIDSPYLGLLTLFGYLPFLELPPAGHA